MPFFVEGQDPLDQQAQAGASPLPVPPIAPQVAVPDDLQPAPGATSGINVAGAAFRDSLSGAVVSAIRRAGAPAAQQEGYNAFEDPQVKGTPAGLQYKSQLMGMNNSDQTRSFLAKAASEESDRQTLASSPGGTAMALVAGLTDPTLYIPVFGEARAAGEVMSAGARVLHGAATFGTQTALSEAGMQGLQADRPLSESVLNVATGAIFGGLIGAGASFLSSAERRAGEAGLDRVRADFSAQAEPSPDAAASPGPGYKITEAPPGSALEDDFTEGATNPNFSPAIRVEGKVYRESDAWVADSDRTHGPPVEMAVGIHGEDAVNAAMETDGLGYADKEGNFYNFLPGHDLFSPQRALIDAAPEAAEAGASRPVDAVAQAAGAAASDERTMQLSKIISDRARRLIAAVPGGETAMNAINSAMLSASPSGRTFLSGSLPGRRAMGDLAETSLKFDQAARGVTAARGVPIDRIVKMQRARMETKTRDVMADGYQKYRGTDGGTLGRVKAQFGPTPDGMMSLTDFKTQVHLAGTQGDVHAIPAVSEAARNLREQVYKPVEQLAQSTKGADGRPMLSDELAPPAGDKSFAPRIWNKKAIAGDPNTFDRIVTDWLMSEQDAKAAAKERLSSLQERHEALGEQADKLDSRLKTIDGRMADTATRADEVGQSVRRGDKRADVIASRAEEIQHAISELQEFANTMRGEADSPARTAHLADLEQEIKALQKQGAPISKTEVDKIEREEVKTTFTPEQQRGAEWAMGNGHAPKKPSALQYFRESGGINDVGGDAASILGKGFQRDARLRGIVKDNGVLGGNEAMSADQWGEKLAGDFPEHFNGERATPDDVHDLLAAGARGEEPSWFTRGREPENVANAREHEAVFSDLLHHIDEHLGKRPANIREFAAQLSELDGLPSAVLRRERARIAALIEQGGVGGAKAEALGARKELLNLVDRAIKSREVKESQLGKVGAAAGERGVEQTAVKGRVAILEGRQVRQQTIKDLLERARANAEDERTALRGKMEDELRAWKGDASADAVSAMKVRDEAERVRGLKQQAGVYEGKGERLTGADGPVDRAVKNILASDRDLSRGEIADRAREIRNRINTAGDGRLPYDIASGGPAMGYPAQRNAPVGSLNKRDFAIPTKSVLPFIHTDPEHVVPAYLRTLLPDLHLTQRFGDAEMTEQFKRINEAYDKKLLGSKGEKQSKAIERARQAETRDLAATRDRVRGVFGMPTTPSQRNLGRISRAVGNWNVGAFLGTSMLNRFQDMANATARRGMMGYMRDGFVPYFKGLSGVEAGSAALRQSVRDMGVGVDTTMGHLSAQFADVTDNHLPGNRFERGTAAAASTAMIVTGHGPWTDLNKQIAGMAASADFLRMAGRLASGKPLANDMRTMAHAGIDPAMAARISNAFENGGHTVVGDAKVPNTADWQDAGARQAFEAAIQKDADIAVVTPGAEKPLFLSDPVYSMLGQFKGFAAAAQERILLSNLQEADGRTLQGFIHMMAMGMLSYKAYTLATGQPTSDRPQDWIKEAVTRAGLMGWMGDLNATQAKFFGGKTDAFRLIGADRPMTRHQSQSALAELLGPTFAELQGISEGVNDAAHGTWTAQDTHKLRQAFYLQNHFAFRKLIDEAEDGINQSQNIQPMNRNPTTWPGS